MWVKGRTPLSWVVRKGVEIIRRQGGGGGVEQRRCRPARGGLTGAPTHQKARRNTQYMWSKKIKGQTMSGSH